MTSIPPIATWLETRTPTPPDALSARIAGMVATQRDVPATPDALIGCAERAMRALLVDGCLTRSSALDLLAIDALITYAFEAAADDPDRLDACADRALTTMAALSEPYRA